MRWEGEIRMLGPARVITPAGQTVSFETKHKQRPLLAYLVLHRRSASGIPEIAEAIWPSEEATNADAENRITGLIMTLRRQIEDADRSAIRTFNGPRYQLDVGPDVVDIDRFTRAANAAISAGLDSPLHVLRLTEAALAEWGEPYQSVKEESWARAAIEALNDLHDQLKRVRAEAFLATGRPDGALRVIESIKDLRNERLVASR